VSCPLEFSILWLLTLKLYSNCPEVEIYVILLAEISIGLLFTYNDFPDPFIII
jgi:hypothetical protein